MDSDDKNTNLGNSQPLNNANEAQNVPQPPLTQGGQMSQPNVVNQAPQGMVVGGEPATGKAFMPNAPVSEYKPKKGKLKILTFGIILLIIVAAAVLLFADKSLQATVFREKFTPYTFLTEKGDKFSINFYRGSTVENLSIGNGQTATELLSPVVKPYPVPIVLGLNGKPNNSNATAQQLLQEGENCTYGTFNTDAFTVYIPSVGANATFCTTSQGIIYQSFFGTSSSVYFMQIGEYSPSVNPSNITPQTEALAQSILNNKLNVNDIQTIAKSFKPLPN